MKEYSTAAYISPRYDTTIKHRQHIADYLNTSEELSQVTTIDWDKYHEVKSYAESISLTRNTKGKYDPFS